MKIAKILTSILLIATLAIGMFACGDETPSNVLNVNYTADIAPVTGNAKAGIQVADEKYGRHGNDER